MAATESAWTVGRKGERSSNRLLLLGAHGPEKRELVQERVSLAMLQPLTHGRTLVRDPPLHQKKSMYLDATRLARAGDVGSIGRGGAAGTPKKDFGKRLDILAALDGVHRQIRASSSASRLADLLDQYVVLTARLAASNTAAPYVPGGAILSAAISALSGGPRSTSGA